MPLAAIKIEPDAFYHEGAIIMALGIPSATIIRARRVGSLRFKRIGKRSVYLGQWLIDWLERVSPVGGMEADHAN